MIWQNPVVRNEMVSTLRSRRGVAVQVVFVLLVALVTVVSWPSGGRYSLDAQQTTRLFTVLSVVEVALIAFAATAFASVTFTVERQRRTLDLLYATRLTPWEIVSGKLVGAIAFLLLLGLLGVPMLVAAASLGGVSTLDIVKVCILLVTGAVLFGVLGLFISSLCTRSFTAVVWSFVLVTFLLLGLTVPGFLGIRYVSEPMQKVLGAVASISPIPAVLHVTMPDFFVYNRLPELNYFGLHLGSVAVVSAVLIAVSRSIMRLPGGRRPRRRTELIAERREMMRRMTRWPYRLIDPQRRKRMIGPLSNVIFIKELRTKAMGKSHYLVRGVYGCLGFSLVLMMVMANYVGTIEVSTYRVAMVVFQLALVLLLTPSLTAGAITDERESGHIDQLRCARIGGFTMVMGKLMAALAPMLILLLATTPIMAALIYFAGNANGVLKGLGTVGAGLLFASVTGLFFSSLAKRTATAVAASYIAVLIFGLGGFAVYFLADNLPRLWVERLLSLNALAAGVAAVSDWIVYPLWERNMFVQLGLALAMFVVASVRVHLLLRVER
jgi:ABC-type transport system involved in multi-copper enzyme maturation permease subunit